MMCFPPDYYHFYRIRTVDTTIAPTPLQLAANPVLCLLLCFVHSTMDMDDEGEKGGEEELSNVARISPSL
jgi:hypothetical protein